MTTKATMTRAAGELFGIVEAAGRLSMSVDALYRLCRAGKVAHYRIGAKGGRHSPARTR
jgi:hypothetical protein